MRHKLAADKGNQQQRGGEDHSRHQHRDLRVIQAPLQLARVLPLHPLEGLVHPLVYALLKPVPAHDRNKRQGQNQRADQSDGHRVGHGPEQLAGRSGERIDREVPGNDHRHRIEDRAVHILRGPHDHIHQVVAGALPLAQLAEDVLHHHQGSVNQDPEIDGSNGKKVRRHSLGVQKDEREQQGERDGERHDDRRPQAHEEAHQHDEDEDHPHHHVVLDRVDGELDQIAAVVIGANPDIRRQNLVVELASFGLHALQHVLRLLAAAHHNDAFDSVVGLVESEFAQPRSVPDGHIADVADADRHPVLRPHDDVPDVFGIANETEAAHVIELPALGIEAAPGIGIVHRQLLDHSRHGHVIRVEFGRIEQHLILHHGAAKAGVVGYPGDLLVFPLDHPVFVDLQLLGRAVRALNDVAVDEARRAGERSQAGRHAGGQRDLAQPLKHDLARPVVVGAFIEGQNDVGESVERDGAHHRHLRDAVHLHLGGHGDQPLHLLGRVTGPLRDDLHHRRRQVRIGIDGHVRERDSSADGEEHHHHEDEESLPECELNDAVDHGSGSSVLQRIGKLQKQAAVAHNFVSGGNAFQDLSDAVLALPGFHLAPPELVGAGGDINKGLVVVVAQHRCIGYGDGVGDSARRHRDRAVHVALQLFAGIIHNDARLQRARVRIKGGRDVGDASMKGVWDTRRSGPRHLRRCAQRPDPPGRHSQAPTRC